ncbi:hypothetical protein COB21_05040 [Candidatus Aerophobetes bacterium]|uniref:Uncharacterized protein n=1 Tax=Aerophobetes bacterium TaxID=2030807 RepID=A0A2A4WZQ7_UNCAE|nr:MAG: hypothetical protein COB21_05040 [Candidatus Aerophobetes bacterium]
MSFKKNLGELESILEKAIKKIRGNKENDLCRYIPVGSGGYMHHFTLRKMKNKNPSELISLLETFILSPTRPLTVPPKQRAARGSRKKKDQLTFTKTQLDRLLNMARLSGDKEMVSVLSPKKSLSHTKRELIQSVRQGVVDHNQWEAYVESVHSQNSLMELASEALS